MIVMSLPALALVASLLRPVPGPGLPQVRAAGIGPPGTATVGAPAVGRQQAKPAPARGQGPVSAECPEGEGARSEAPLGIAVCQGTARVAVRMATDPQPGARVARVAADSPAARAGLAPNDVIYLVAGARVQSGAEALARLGTSADNAIRIQINFWRDGLPFIVRIPVEKRRAG